MESKLRASGRWGSLHLEYVSGSVCCSKPAPPVPTEVEEVEEEEGGCEARKRHGIDLATTLERIQKNFVITDPRLPDNPIVTTHPLLLLGIELGTEMGTAAGLEREGRTEF